MPDLSKIATHINAKLKAGFNTKNFAGALYSNIAEPVLKETNDGGVLYPCIVANDGECTELVVNDTYPMQVYHKTGNLNFDTGSENEYGDPGDNLQETASMALILIANRNLIQVSKEDIATGLALYLPKNVKRSEISSPNFISCTIEAGQVNINTRDVFAQEYGNVDFSLPPNYIMISLPYTVVTICNKSCFNICT